MFVLKGGRPPAPPAAPPPRGGILRDASGTWFAIPDAGAEGGDDGLPAAFRAVAGQPAEAFCVPPDPGQLPALAASWTAAAPQHAPALMAAIADARARAAARRPWLNRWDGDGRPDGLWHWSWTVQIAPCSMFNGGDMRTSYVWAVFAAGRLLPAVRCSASAKQHMPPGLAIGCVWWMRVEEPWHPGAEGGGVRYESRLDLSRPHAPACVRGTWA